jgi:hypothetical protein
MKSEWLFFEDLQSHVLKVAVGFAAFNLALPPIAKEVDKISNIGFEGATKLFSIIHFVMPAFILFLLWSWWVTYGNNGFLRLGKSGYSKTINQTLIILFFGVFIYLALFFCFFPYDLAWTYPYYVFILLPLILLLIYVWKIIVKFNRKNLFNQNLKEDFTLGWVQFGFLIATIILIGWVFLSKSDNYFLDKNIVKSEEIDFQYYENDKTLEPIQNRLISLYEQEQNRTWLQSLMAKQITLPSYKPTDYKKLANESKNEKLINTLYEVDTLLRNGKNISLGIDVISPLIDSLENNLKQQRDSTAQHHNHNALFLSQISTVVNNLRYEMQSKFLGKFSPYLENIFYFGFLLLLLSLFACTVIWLHLFFENLFKLDREVYKEKTVELKDFRAFPQIKIIKSFLFLLLLLSIPNLRDLSEESLYRKNPLQPFFISQSENRIKRTKTWEPLPPEKPDITDSLINDLNKNLTKHSQKVREWNQKHVADRHDNNLLSDPIKFGEKK